MQKLDSYIQYFELMFKNTMDVHFIVNKQRHLVYATPSFFQITGFTPEESKNVDGFEVLVHPEDKQYMIERHKNLIATGKRNTTEYRIITKSGEIRHWECKTTPLPNTEEYLQVVSVRDFTERKLVEKELERRKDRYELLQQSLKKFSHDLSAVMKVSDLEDRLVRELASVLPNSEPNLLIINLEKTPDLDSHFYSLSVGRLESFSEKLLIKIGERKESSYVLSLNASAITETMDSIWLETLAQYAVMVFENLNVIENLMNQLKTALESRETPQWVLRLLFNLQERQRMNLSSDLHDTVLQEQIDLYRRLDSLLAKGKLEGRIKAELKDIEQGLLDTIHQIRATCNELRPPLLRELGLERSLENLFDHTQLSSTYKIDFTAEQTSACTLTEEQTIGIYRVVQELLNNASKHSKASLLHFHLKSQDGYLTLAYRDDGIGFAAEKMNPTFKSMGLTGMLQRVQSLDGKIDFYSQPGQGLKVTLQIPIQG